MRKIPGIAAERPMTWSGEAGRLLDRAIERHGGWSAWTSIQSLPIVPEMLGGLLPAMKGHRRTFHLPPRAQIFPHEQKAVFQDYPIAGGTGLFQAGAVRLLDADGTERKSSADHRTTFRGLRKWRRWSPMDALYFFGYALTHYQSLPFSLRDARPLRLRRARVGGLAVDGVEVELPERLATHCRRQTFYFGDDGLLLRHDYVAEIVGAWARGAHLWRNYRSVQGVLAAQERLVVARLGSRTTPIVALQAKLSFAADEASRP